LGFPVGDASDFSSFSLGLDANLWNDGGFYDRPIFAYGLNDIMEVNFSYTGISLDGFTWSMISLGFMNTIPPFYMQLIR